MNAETKKMPEQNTVSVVVPVYFGEKTIEELVERLVEVFRRNEQGLEVLLINDGSEDDSWGVIQELAARYPQVKGINLMRNFGQHNAILAGIRIAEGQIIVTMDDDLQNPPEEVPKLLEKLANGHDVVYGVPEQEQHGRFRDLASVMTKFLMRVGLGFKQANKSSAFRAFRADLRRAFEDFHSRFVSIDVLLTWATDDFDWVAVRHEERPAGKSGYNLRKLFTHMMNMVTSFSTIPLKLASFVGFAFTVFGFLFLIYILYNYLAHGSNVPGFAFLGSMIAIFSGVQLFSLGIIGEYIGRIHQRALNEPCYVIADKTED
jgi:undecaprenyl-phosphate 4-deoxy-4-formamido-L-arabinose transferase